MAAEIDVYGIEDILKKFDLHRCEDFAVLCGQGNKLQMKFAGSGKELFHENIQCIDPQNDSTYQVRFYKGEFDEDKITNATPYSSSFNFKVRPKVNMAMSGSGQVRGQSSGGYLSEGDRRYMDMLQEQVRKLEQEKSDLQYELGDLQDQIKDYEDKGKNKKVGALGQIGQAMGEYPQLQQLLQPLVARISDMLVPGTAYPPQYQQQHYSPGPGIGHVKEDTMFFGNKSNTAAPAAPMTPDQVEELFKTAILKLNAYYTKKYGDSGDQQFTEDIYKLAQLTENPFIFDAAISQLRGM